ncbi:MAG: cyclic nucleotide-binding domain-containing protein, partial [Bacteroidia bacterium]|nr:cyclic nucleotide-binding domain-containing protein [Bacteroidia bacterium]
MSKEQLLYTVYQHPLLTQSDLAQLCRAHEKVTFRKNSLLLQSGQTANEYLIIESGLMRSFVMDTDGNDITTNFFSEGEIVIEVSSLFQRIPTRENIQALTDCTCWKIDFDVFQHLFHSIKGFSEWGRSWMAGELFRFKQRSIEMIA